MHVLIHDFDYCGVFVKSPDTAYDHFIVILVLDYQQSNHTVYLKVRYIVVHFAQ